MAQFNKQNNSVSTSDKWDVIGKQGNNIGCIHYSFIEREFGFKHTGTAGISMETIEEVNRKLVK